MTFTVCVLCYVAANMSSLGFQPQVWPMCHRNREQHRLSVLSVEDMDTVSVMSPCRLSLYLDTMSNPKGVTLGMRWDEEPAAIRAGTVFVTKLKKDFIY